jgi:hypothetical protein
MGDKETFRVIRDSVDKAVERLFINDRDLLDINVNERSISHKLAEYLQIEFPDWHVDCEYNRKMRDIKKLLIHFDKVSADDNEASTVYPDIIIHHRQTNDNLLVIEIKKYGLDTAKDMKKLKAFTGPDYEYRFGLLLEMTPNGETQKKWFVKGTQRQCATEHSAEDIGYGE